MCCAMSLVCPSIATRRTCQFWARSEPVNLPKTIVSGKCGVHAVIRFIYSEKERGMLSSGIVLLHDSAQLHTAVAIKRLLKRFRWEVFDHPPSSAETWLPVIFISFLVWNGRRRTTFWQNELQTSVKTWLEAQWLASMTRVLESWYHATKNIYVGASTM